MKHFQKVQNWVNLPNSRRVQLNYSDGLAERAIYIAIQPGKLTDFDSFFYLDINRELSNSAFSQLTEGLDAYVFRPVNWSELIQSILEVNDYTYLRNQDTENQARTTLILNDWQSLVYLFSSSRKVVGPNPSELLLQLKFLSDRANIVLLNGSAQYSSFQIQDRTERDILSQWAQLCLRIVDENTLTVERSTLLEWKTGQAVRVDQAANVYPFPESKKQGASYSINSVQSLNIVSPRAEAAANGPIENPPNNNYEALLLKLAEAKSRQDLLVVRKEIQALSGALSSQEKVALSDIYKVHLQRIKLIEDNFLSAPLNIDVG